MSDTRIFGLRFKTNEKLQPSFEEMKAFLASKKTGVRGLHGDDLKQYQALLAGLEAFKAGSPSPRLSEKMQYTVLDHSHFAKPALKLAIEQYKYHLYTLSNLDFKKPGVFIKSAEEEIARLNPRKSDEAARIERMRGMIEERKRALDGQHRLWRELTEELSNIIAYIADNLARIEDLCEKSISCLVNEQIDRKKELSLIEDIKIHFKEKLRDALHQGTISKEQLETAKEEVTDLSKRTADMLRSDVYSMTQLYEAVLAHAFKVVNDLGEMVEEIKRRKHASLEDDLALYSQVEKILIALISEYRFDVVLLEINYEMPHSQMLADKRKEIFEHLFDILPKT